jgi:hypothetical protein
MQILKRFWPSAIVLAVILYATWLPGSVEPDGIPQIPYIDKLIHAIMFGGFAGAIMFDYERNQRGYLITATILRISLAVAAFSIVDEVVQGLLPIGRPSDYLDLLADWLGIAVAYFSAPPTIRLVLPKK